MLIGISGKIGSGKDTVAKAIQFIMFQEKLKNMGKKLVGSDSVHESVFFNWPDAQREQWSNFVIEKYAGALKDIICRMIGCTRDELEDAKFKETELGDEWACWFISDGKYPKLFPIDADINWLANGEKYFRRNATPRMLLQLMGTECGRLMLHPNIWINALYARYKPTNNCTQHADGLYYTNEHGENEVNPIYPNWIITDVRFPNELDALKDRGGISIRVERNYYEKVGKVLLKNVDLHPSETALDSATFDYMIDNNGTITELIEKTREILSKEGIINI